ncbi:hypothetical protein GSY69_10130 [Brevibacterium sp. 5221]|uniref:N-acetylmuramoyl-L-alanine amidase n=1 Tax=Brevibacterium rongguiense TaxID=2695267 RepID=A0A6N9H907_9MICO|nr:N-acetylmuramoyl-L-alanine amidase [Brevibacterium rongguiense]MYM20311.1 hypothetical protein [Brevibacterium rongguiense]
MRSAKPAAATKSLAVEAFETPTSGADAAAAGDPSAAADTSQGELGATAENASVVQGAAAQSATAQGAGVQNVAAKSANIPNLGRIVTRAGWGANEKLVRCKADTTDVNKALIIHHTSGATNYSRSQVPGILRGYLEFHTKGRKWCDLGYNMLVDRYGTIYEGRRGAPYSGRPVVGAHASGFNTHTFGVSVMGTFNSRQPTSAAVKSVKRIATWQAVKWGWNPGGKVKLTAAKGDTVKYKAGTVVTKSTIFGHRDTSYTDCPGTKFYAMLPSIRKSVAASAKKAGPKHAIAGAIRTYYYTHNGTVTIGMPKGREANRLRSGGARQTFAKATLSWSKATKVQPVRSGFLTAYRKLGYEKSKLGYPTGAERKVKGLARQDFQGGSMVWQKGRAVIAYNNKVKAVK